MTGLAFTRSCGIAVDISWYTLIFSLMARSMRRGRCGTGFEQFADRANAAVAEMVDVIHNADVFAQLEEILDRRHEVRRIQGAIVERRVQPHLDVEFQAADAAEIVLPRIEEHAAEKIRGRFECRRIAGAQLAIDFDQRFLRRANRILVQRARKHHADIVALGEEHVDFGDATFGKGPARVPRLAAYWLRAELRPSGG